MGSKRTQRSRSPRRAPATSERPSTAMVGSAVKRAHGEGTPVKLRDGPAAVRGVALRHQATGASREGGEGGASSQKTYRSPSIPNPSRKEDSWLNASS